MVKLLKEPWIILRYDKTILTAPSSDPKKKLYDLIHSAGSNISEITDNQVQLGKLEGTAAGMDTADLPSLFVVRSGFQNTLRNFSNFFLLKPKVKMVN